MGCPSTSGRGGQMQGAASGNSSFSELMAARKEQQRNGLASHREQLQARVQDLRRLQSSRPPTATPKTIRILARCCILHGGRRRRRPTLNGRWCPRRRRLRRLIRNRRRHVARRRPTRHRRRHVARRRSAWHRRRHVSRRRSAWHRRRRVSRRRSTHQRRCVSRRRPTLQKQVAGQQLMLGGRRHVKRRQIGTQPRSGCGRTIISIPHSC